MAFAFVSAEHVKPAIRADRAKAGHGLRQRREIGFDFRNRGVGGVIVLIVLGGATGQSQGRDHDQVCEIE